MQLTYLVDKPPCKSSKRTASFCMMLPNISLLFSPPLITFSLKAEKASSLQRTVRNINKKRTYSAYIAAFTLVSSSSSSSSSSSFPFPFSSPPSSPSSSSDASPSDASMSLRQQISLHQNNNAFKYLQEGSDVCRDFPSLALGGCIPKMLLSLYRKFKGNVNKYLSPTSSMSSLEWSGPKGNLKGLIDLMRSLKKRNKLEETIKEYIADSLFFFHGVIIQKQVQSIVIGLNFSTSQVSTGSYHL
jgi:hypothetical protein